LKRNLSMWEFALLYRQIAYKRNAIFATNGYQAYDSFQAASFRHD
jgi:hypothetical protein